MTDLISDQKICVVATSGISGRVNVSPKKSIMVMDNETLAFADCHLKKTRANLPVNPNTAIAVIDPKVMKGFQFKGKAEFV